MSEEWQNKQNDVLGGDVPVRFCGMHLKKKRHGSMDGRKQV